MCPFTEPSCRRPASGLYSEPVRRNVAPLSLLTLLTLTASAGVVTVVVLLLARPTVAPPWLRPPHVGAWAPPGSPTAPPATPPAWPSMPPTNTPLPATLTASPGPSASPGQPLPPPPTVVLAAPSTALPNLNSTAAASLDGRVAADGNGLRLRAFPGTAGEVVAYLDARMPLSIIGRTPASDWLEVLTPAGQRGWVMAEFVEVYIDLLAVPQTAAAALDATPTPSHSGEARVAAGGDNLRLRQSPGTAGAIIASLPPMLGLDLVGRTADNAWLEVVTAAGRHGWVMARFVEVFIDLAGVPVTGQAVDATAAPSTTPFVYPTVPSTQVGSLPALPSSTPPPATSRPPSATTPAPTWTSPPPQGSYVDGQYITGISEHTREIYLAGLSLGNRPNVFSKVGDSITVAPQFLVAFGTSQYNLRDYGYLSDVVNFFAAGAARTGNPFNNTSLAAKSGWSSYSVLAASAADPSLCRTTESPLVCEYRLNRPAIALIMLGTNDVVSTSSDAFRANLRRVVDDSVRMGVIPVLSTIPAFLRSGYEARPAELNDIIVGVAQEYNVPVWHYWAAMQPLPNLGLATDGVHPSWAPNPADFTPANLQYGFTVRNLTALHVLDAVWRQAMY